VTLIITETNNSNDPATELWLSEPRVNLEPGGYILNRTSSYFYGGDDKPLGHGNLEVGETWEWRVDVTINADTLFTVIGHGYIKGYTQYDVTYGVLNEQGEMAYPNEKAEFMVKVIRQLPATVGNFVWADKNANGIQDAGEPGVGGIRVELYVCGGSASIMTTTTASNGSYTFTGLTPGSYFLKFIKPFGYDFSPVNQGGNPAKDSDANPAGITACTTLDSGETDLTWDAGLKSQCIKDDHENCDRDDHENCDRDDHENNDKGYNNKGYNDKGYNNKGYNDKGYNNKGYNDKGYNEKGYNEKGYNEKGYNEKGNRK
jgi:hypothetical protein